MLAFFVLYIKKKDVCWYKGIINEVIVLSITIYINNGW